MAPERTVRRSDDAPVKLFGQIIVNNRDDCITLFNDHSIYRLFHVTNSNKNTLKCLLDETA
jgi:hypothetical protein